MNKPSNRGLRKKTATQAPNGPDLRKWLAFERQEGASLEQYPILKIACVLARYPLASFRDADDETLERLWEFFVQNCRRPFGNGYGIFGPVPRHLIDFDYRPLLTKHLRLEYSRLLDWLRPKISKLFDDIGAGRPASIPLEKGRICLTRVRGKWIRRYENEFRSWILMVLLDELEKVGFDSVKKCPECGKILIRLGKREFCSRRCLEAKKTKCYRSSPDQRERHAYIVWRRYRRINKHPFPTTEDTLAWQSEHRELQKKRGKTPSTQSVKKLMHGN